jgi:replication-associated recombination protein RarA
MMQIIDTTELKPPRVLLYGTEGIGKTTFGARSPSPLFILT